MSDQEPEQARSERARYYAEHRDEELANSRAWKRANRERSRAHNRESMRRAAEREKKRRARNSTARDRYAENRDAERARLRTFRLENPDRVREYQRRYKERHPERAEQQRQATLRHRAQNPEKYRADDNRRAAEYRARNPDAQRNWYAANVEAQRKRTRENAAARRRLEKLGLPPRQIHRVYATEKRINADAADKFFQERRSKRQMGLLQKERRRSEPESRLAIAHREAKGARERAKARTALDSPSLSEILTLRAASAAARLELKLRETLPDLIDTYRARYGDRIAEEVRMDSVARVLRGKPPLEVAKETERRIVDAVIDARGSRLPADAADRLRASFAPMSGGAQVARDTVNASYPSAPHLTAKSPSVPRPTAPDSRLMRETGVER